MSLRPRSGGLLMSTRDGLSELTIKEAKTYTDEQLLNCWDNNKFAGGLHHTVKQFIWDELIKRGHTQHEIKRWGEPPDPEKVWEV